MKLREVEQTDIEDIDRLNNQQDFKIATIDDCIIDRVVEEDGKIIAYGIVKKMGEAIFLVDKTTTKVSRVKAMMELMQIALFGTRKAGCSQLHVFVKDPKLARALEKHFGFKRTEDIVLVKNL